MAFQHGLHYQKCMIKLSKGNTMKNIKSTNKAITATSNEGYGLGSGKDAREGFMSDAIASKALTAWAVEVNGEIDPRDIFPARMWARETRNDYADHFGITAKVSVRKVMITQIDGR